MMLSAYSGGLRCINSTKCRLPALPYQLNHLRDDYEFCLFMLCISRVVGVVRACRLGSVVNVWISI